MQSNGKLLQLVFDVPLPAVDFIDNAPKHQRAYYQCFEPVGVYLGVSLDIADDPMDFIGQIFEALVGQTDDRRQTKITLFRKVEQFDPEQPGDLLSGVLSRAPKHAGLFVNQFAVIESRRVIATFDTIPAARGCALTTSTKGIEPVWVWDGVEQKFITAAYNGKWWQLREKN